MDKNEAIKMYQKESDTYKFECARYRRVRQMINPITMTEAQEFELFRAHKRFKTACKRYHAFKDDYRRTMMEITGRVVKGDTKSILKEVRSEAQLDSGYFEQELRKMFPNKNEDEIQEMLNTAKNKLSDSSSEEQS